METYKLIIKTSNEDVAAGTDSTVKIQITGETGKQTDWKVLDKFFKDDFLVGSLEEYDVEHKGEKVGKPVIISLQIRGFIITDAWLCDYVVIHYQQSYYEFPVYDWIEKEIVSVTASANLPQYETMEAIKKMRRDEVEQNKKIFAWMPKPKEGDIGWGMPRFLNCQDSFKLPNIFQRTTTQMKNRVGSTLKAGINTGRVKFEEIYKKLTCLDDYRSLYSGTGKKDPCFIHCWKEDTEFGRQILNGISPVCFERCEDKLPSHVNIRNDHVVGLLKEGETFQSEMKNGKIYLADFSTLTKGVGRNKNPKTKVEFICPDSAGLFYVNKDEQFVPIAIQLEVGQEETIFTPKDTEYDWMLAKMYFRVANGNTHGWIHHYHNTHGASEVFAIATFRCLARCHPVFKLLSPHLKTVAAVNTDGRRFLIHPESLASHSNAVYILGMVRNYFTTFDISNLDIPLVLERQGLDDREKLPNFYYRDDALDIWKAVEDYVAQIIRHFYKCDEDVITDTEIQDWIHDLGVEGIGWMDGNKRGIPDNVESVDQLIKLCTIVIFTSTAQHAAVNFGQMETYQFIPNAPGSMNLPIHKRGEGSLKRVLESLPDAHVSNLLIIFAFALSEYTKDEVFLGDVPERLFTTQPIIEIQQKFKENLGELDKKFLKRNESLKFPYTYLLPENIPISTAI